MRVAWTGHRPELFADPAAARALVERETDRLRSAHGTDLFVLSGGQRGVDLWAASAAARRQIPFALLLPAPAASFAADWPPDEAAALATATEQAQSVQVYGPAVDDPSGYTARNRALASGCDLIVVVWTATRGGGTAFTIAEAEARGKPMREYVLERSRHVPAEGERGI